MNDEQIQSHQYWSAILAQWKVVFLGLTVGVMCGGVAYVLPPQIGWPMALYR